MRKLSLILVICILLFCFETLAFAQKAEVAQIKKTIVFLGELNDKGEPEYKATGFLVSIKGVFHLVTAKHVVMENIKGKFTGKMIDSSLYAFLNTKNEKLEKKALASLKTKYNVNWIFHPTNEDVDIAIIPFDLDVNNYDVKVIPDELFLSTERLFEIYDVYYLSFQPGTQSTQKIAPIVRTGAISLLREDNTFYIDGFSFPGNSGSPVFLRPSPIRFDEASFNIGGDSLGNKFIGIIGEYITYQEIAISTQTLRPRVLFEENTGLSKVWSVSFIKEIIDSDVFKKQLNTILKK